MRRDPSDGPHIWEDHFYAEVIDPVTGAVLPDGEHGELVFTTLTKEAMPGHPLSHARPDAALAGARGVTMRRMEKVTGRSDDMIHPARRQPLSLADRVEQILKCAGLAPHFQPRL